MLWVNLIYLRRLSGKWAVCRDYENGNDNNIIWILYNWMSWHLTWRVTCDLYMVWHDLSLPFVTLTHHSVLLHTKHAVSPQASNCQPNLGCYLPNCQVCLCHGQLRHIIAKIAGEIAIMELGGIPNRDTVDWGQKNRGPRTRYVVSRPYSSNSSRFFSPPLA